MKCPNCDETLLMTERHTVSIDYCPKCRGVWLDKGELDKLLDQAGRRNEGNSSMNQNNDPQYYTGKGAHSDSKYSPHGRKKRSFLSDFFDFD